MLAVHAGVVLTRRTVPVFKGVSPFGYNHFYSRNIFVQTVSRHETAYTAADYRDIVFDRHFKSP